jgi:hypothetical protein
MSTMLSRHHRLSAVWSFSFSLERVTSGFCQDTIGFSQVESERGLPLEYP